FSSTISVNGVPRDDWGMWTALAPGTYTVHYGLVAGYDPPADQTAVVTAGATTTITGNFVTNAAAPGPDPTTFGYLRVTTNPATAAQILVNGVPADDWGLTWVKLAPGTSTVSFGQGSGFTPPRPTQVTAAAGDRDNCDDQRGAPVSECGAINCGRGDAVDRASNGVSTADDRESIFGGWARRPDEI